LLHEATEARLIAGLRITMRSRTIVLAAFAVALTACKPVPDDSRVVGEWTRVLYGLVRVERLAPTVAARVYAYASTALYLGMASADPARPDVAGLYNGLPEMPRAKERADATLIAVTAERVVLDSLFADGLATSKSAIARFADSIMAARSAQVTSSAVQAASKTLGEEIGRRIVAWSRADGFDSTRGRPFKPAVGRGLWVNDNPASTYTTQNLSGASTLVTPDNPANARRGGNVSDRGLILSNPKAPNRTLPAVNMAGATEPYWGQLRLFALPSFDACPVPELPPFSTEKSSSTYQEALEVHEFSKSLTPEQRAIALFWADNAGETGTPGGHWLYIASQMAGEKQLSALETSRLMMQTSIAVADAFIAAWRVKFQMNTIRPRTYIRMTMDPMWEPLISTPPFPEYVSGHSAISAAAATAITGQIGAQSFSDSTSVSLGHPVRRFDSFMSAAEEAGQSRLYGGIHFKSGNLEGRKLGICIGNAALERMKGRAGS
jgi:membrane-associated phospholipid phosphatase